MKNLFSTSTSFAPTVARLALAGTLFPHGAQKLLGWFGGYGFNGTMAYFTDTVGVPYALGLGAIMLESIGMVLLLMGVAVRPIAALTVALAFSIAGLAHWPNGFFMNWFGNQPGEGVEYFILMAGLAGSLTVSGGGAWSVDAGMARWAWRRPVKAVKHTVAERV